MVDGAPCPTPHERVVQLFSVKFFSKYDNQSSGRRLCLLLLFSLRSMLMTESHFRNYDFRLVDGRI